MYKIWFNFDLLLWNDIMMSYSFKMFQLSYKIEKFDFYCFNY